MELTVLVDNNTLIDHYFIGEPENTAYFAYLTMATHKSPVQRHLRRVASFCYTVTYEQR